MKLSESQKVRLVKDNVILRELGADVFDGLCEVQVKAGVNTAGTIDLSDVKGFNELVGIIAIADSPNTVVGDMGAVYVAGADATSADVDVAIGVTGAIATAVDSYVTATKVLDTPCVADAVVAKGGVNKVTIKTGNDLSAKSLRISYKIPDATLRKAKKLVVTTDYTVSAAGVITMAADYRNYQLVVIYK